MASPAAIPKESHSQNSMSPLLSSIAAEEEELAHQDDHPKETIIVEAGPLSPLIPYGLTPPDAEQDDVSMPSLSEEDPVSDVGVEHEEDEEDEEQNEVLLDVTVEETDYLVPLKEPEDVESTREHSENSVSVNGAETKIELEGSMTRGGKLRKLAPPPLKRRKTPTGRSRTPRAPSPIIPPRSNSPWPDIQDSDIRHEEDRDSKRRRTDLHDEDMNGTRDSTPQPTRALRRQDKDGQELSVEDALKRSKRVKISPRKEKYQPSRQRSPAHPITAAAALVREDAAVSGTTTPRIIVNIKSSEKDETDPTRYNEEVCGACGGPGRFLCCEGCPKSFHFTCLDPPVDENDLPEDSWYCNSCRALRDPPPHSDNRLFEKLIDKMNRMNPVAFHLPKDIRNYFEGVTTGDDGEYQETHEVKAIRANARGFIDEPDPFRLRDKNGRPVYCFRCGETASSARRILNCDHCNQNWHMDCLDPPLTALPPLTKKWMCPLHASHAYRRMRRPKHKARVVDVSLPRGFKSGWADIEVENDETEEDEKIGHELLEDGFESEFEIDGTTYRLPEKAIKLDFLEKIHMESLRPRSLDILSEEASYLPPAPLNTRLRMEDVLRPSRGKEQKQEAFKMLLQAALVEYPTSETDSSPGSSKENNSIRQLNGESDIIREKEARQLRAVRRLMEMKGYEAMMTFLES